MQAYMCDICEQFFTEQKDLGIRGTRCVLSSGAVYVDICPDCVAAIQNTINRCSEKKEVIRDGK